MSAIGLGEILTFTANGTPTGGSFKWSGYFAGSGSSKSVTANASVTEYTATVVYTRNGLVSQPKTVIVPVSKPILTATVEPSVIEVGESATFLAVDEHETEHWFTWSGAVTGGGALKRRNSILLVITSRP